MAKRKKNKKGGGKYKLSNILLHYKQKNYATALKQLKSVSIRAHEKETINWLKDYLPVAIAYQHFCDFEYQKVVDSLGNQTENSPKKAILLGLSYLYLGNFQAAGKALKEAIQTENLSSFGFYYLLAVVYHEKQEETAFMIEYADTFDVLESDRKAYLKTIIALRNDEIESAKAYLSTISSEHPNIHLLKNFFEGTAFEKGDFNVKGLYKILGELPYAEKEIAYLSDFSVLSEELKGAKKTNLKEKYGAEIKELCIAGNPLPSSRFILLKDKLPKSIKSKFIYNQIATLYNQSNRNLKQVRKQIDAYAEDFFRVVESMDLYLATFDYDEEEVNYRSTNFWRNINYYLDNFYEVLSLQVINRVGWKIYDIANFFERALLDQKYGIPFLQKIMQKYDKVLAFKVKDIFLSLPVPNHQVSKNALELFSSDFFEEYQKTITLELVVLFHENSLFGMRDEMKAMIDQEYATAAAKIIERDSLNIYLQMLKQFYENIYTAFENYEIHKSAVSVVEVMDILTRNLVYLKTEEPQVDLEEWQKRGRDIYKKIFKIHTKIKENDTAYQTLLHLGEIQKLQEAVEVAVRTNSVVPVISFLEKGMINTANRFILVSGLKEFFENDKHTLIADYLIFLAKKERYDGVASFFKKEVVPLPLDSEEVIFPILTQFYLTKEPVPAQLLFLVLQYGTNTLLDTELWIDNLEIVEKIIGDLKETILTGNLEQEQAKVTNKLLEYIKEIGNTHGLNELKRLYKELSKTV